MRKIGLILLLFATVSACINIEQSASTANLPEESELVSDLLLDESSLPPGWVRERDWPKGSLEDPSINHVYRSWWMKSKNDGAIEQSIWRSTIIEDAEKRFTNLRQGQFLVGYTPNPNETFIQFSQTENIDFRSQSVDDFYLACGWLNWGYCEAVARYRNYVVDIRFDLNQEYKGYKTVGLDYEEIESILIEMDKQFSTYLSEDSY